MSLRYEQIQIANLRADTLRSSPRSGIDDATVSHPAGQQISFIQSSQAACRSQNNGAFVWARRLICARELQENFANYVAGWAKTDPDQILSGVTEDYTFNDPLVGTFNRTSLPDYFAILRDRLAFNSVDPSPRQIVLHGASPSSIDASRLRLWRQVLDTGLSGTAEIDFRTNGIARETVCYECNMATEQLRHAFYARTKPSVPAVDGLWRTT